MNLHQQFLNLAQEKNKIVYKLLALLPEIYAKGIYKKYTRTIQGYAWQFAQIPESAVDKVLNLNEKLSDRPLLKASIEEVGVYKVAMLESLITPENESVMVEKLQNMSSQSIQALSKELRNKEVTVNMTFNLTPEMQKLWNTAKKLMNASQESDLNVLKNLLENFVTSNYENEPVSIESKTRYIPKKIKKEIYQKFDNKCSHPNCEKVATELHHSERFSASKNHKRIVPLCKQHHEFMHNNLIKNELDKVYNWELSPEKTTHIIDLKYQKMRN